jgi:ferredoxin
MNFEQKIRDPKSEECKIIAEILGQGKPYKHRCGRGQYCFKCSQKVRNSFLKLYDDALPCQIPDPPKGSLADIAFACQRAMDKDIITKSMYNDEFSFNNPTEVTPEMMIETAIKIWREFKAGDK